MKNKIKNSVFSLLVAIAIILGCNFTFAFALVNSFNQSATAEYKPTDFVSPYEFSSSTGWTSKSVSASTVTSTFTGSAVSKNISTLTEHKPETNYKGDPTNVTDGSISDFGSMVIKTNNTPTTTEIEKTDDDGKVVWEMDGDNFVYIEDDQGNKKEYPSNNGDTERFVLKEGTTSTYYQKKAVMEKVNVYYYYQSNTSLSLKANNWYVLGAYVCTFSADASIMVTGTKFEKEVKIPDTNGEWQLVYLFLETSSDSTNSVNIRFYYGSSEGVSFNTAGGITVSGSVYVDHITVQTISKTEYLMQTIGGEELESDADVHTYSVRYDYEINKINNNFENITDNGDGTYSFNLYKKLYGEQDYDANADELINQNYYQYYINKYTDDKGTDKLTDKQLGLYHKAYKEKLKASIALESKEFETEEDVLDENKNPVLDGNGDVKTEIVPAFSTFNSENHILKLENTSEKYSLGLLSAPISINQFSYYKLSLFAKGLSAEDSATVKLISYIKTGTSSAEGSLQVKSQTITPYTSSSDITNNWTEISFYIQGSSYYDTTMQIALLADKESTVYYDSIRLESITSTTYSNATSSKKFDLFPSATAITSSITNGNFDSVKTEDIDPSDITKPYLPNSWTKVDDSSKDAISGIVSTTDDFYSKNKNNDNKTIQEILGGATNPITDYNLNGTMISPARTNVLAMYLPKTVDGKDTNHDIGYKSSSISLSSNSAYKITFEVFVSNSSADSEFEGSIYANLIASDENIAEFKTKVELYDNDLKGKWITYTFAVHTGSSSRSVYIELGVEDATGTAFFQKVRYTKLAEKTVNDEKISVNKQFQEIKNEFNTVEKQTANNIKFVDYEKDAFLMHSENKVQDKDYYSSLSHKLRTEEDDKKTTDVDESIIEQGEMGIVDLTESDGLTLSANPLYNLESSFLNNPKASNSFGMVIYNSSNYYTSVRPKNEISLSSSSYYEISIYVKTKDIAEGNGLKIYMDKISVTFDNINTEKNNYGDLTESNGYKKFTAYVKTGESTISGLQIVYELGSSNNKFTGTALLSNLQITKLDDEEAYNELVQSIDSNDKTTVIKDFAPTEEEHKHEHEHADNLTLSTFFLVFSSILLVAVLVFALVSVYIKKVPTNKTVSGTNKANVKKEMKSDVQKDGFV